MKLGKTIITFEIEMLFIKTFCLISSVMPHIFFVIVKFIFKLLNNRGVCCSLFFVFSVLFLCSKYVNYLFVENFGNDEEHQIDVVDFHFMAVNYAYCDQLLVVGYLNDSTYHINRTEQIAYYLDILEEYGPVEIFARFPAQPLILGTLYKCFGVKYYFNVWINILLIAIMVSLMPWIGKKMHNIHGHVLGLIAGCLLLIFNVFDIRTVSPDLFAAFFALLLYLIALQLQSSKKWVLLHILAGLCLGASLLSKAVFVFLIPLFPLYIFLSTEESYSTKLKKGLFFMCGAAILLAPYLFYMHSVKTETQLQRARWASEIQETMQLPELGNINEFDAKISESNIDKAGRDALYDYIFKSILITHAAASQDQFLFVKHLNNEYCVNGEYFHPEWMFLKNSYYRTHASDSVSGIMKVINFYLDNINLANELIKVKILSSARTQSSFFWISGALWGWYLLFICVIKKMALKHLKIMMLLVTVLICIITLLLALCEILDLVWISLALSVVGFICLVFDRVRAPKHVLFGIFWANIFLFILTVIPDERFLKMLFPINCLAMSYYGYAIIHAFMRIVILQLQKNKSTSLPLV